LNILSVFKDLVFRCIPKKVTVSFIMNVCPSLHPAAWNNSAPTGWIFMKFDIFSIFKKSVKKFQVSLKLSRIMSTLCEDLCIFMIVSCQILLRMRNVSDKNCKQNQNTHFMRSNFFFPPLKIMHSMRYFLTPWRRLLLEKLTGSAASQEIPCIFFSFFFLTVPTSARHLSLS
jgi:hypothetical protein